MVLKWAKESDIMDTFYDKGSYRVAERSNGKWGIYLIKDLKGLIFKPTKNKSFDTAEQAMKWAEENLIKKNKKLNPLTPQVLVITASIGNADEDAFLTFPNMNKLEKAESQISKYKEDTNSDNEEWIEFLEVTAKKNGGTFLGFFADFEFTDG